MRQKLLKTFITGLVLACNCLVNIANAGLIVYTDRGDWLAAIGAPDFTENFNSITSDTLVNESTFILNGVSYQDSGYRNILIDSIGGVFGSGIGIDNTTFLNLPGYNNNSYLNVLFPEYVSAFGWDTLNYDHGNEQAIIQINGNMFDAVSSKSCGSDCNVTGFFGVVATEGSAFNSVLVTAPVTEDGSLGTYNGFDNLAYKTATYVPEPSTIAIFALGMIGLTSRRFKKQS